MALDNKVSTAAVQGYKNIILCCGFLFLGILIYLGMAQMMSEGQGGTLKAIPLTYQIGVLLGILTVLVIPYQTYNLALLLKESGLSRFHPLAVVGMYFFSFVFPVLTVVLIIWLWRKGTRAVNK